MQIAKIGPYSIPSADIIKDFTIRFCQNDNIEFDMSKLISPDELPPSSSGGGTNNSDWVGLVWAAYTVTQKEELFNWLKARILKLDEIRNYRGGEYNVYNWDNAHSQEASTMLLALVTFRDLISTNWKEIVGTTVSNRLIGNPRAIGANGIWDTNTRILSRLFRFEAACVICKDVLINQGIIPKYEINNALRRIREHIKYILYKVYDTRIKDWQAGWAKYSNGTPFWAESTNRSGRPEINKNGFYGITQAIPSFMLGHIMPDGLKWIIEASKQHPIQFLFIKNQSIKRLGELATWWWNYIYSDCDDVNFRGYPHSHDYTLIWNMTLDGPEPARPKCGAPESIEKWFSCVNLSDGFNTNASRSLVAQYMHHGPFALYWPENLNFIYNIQEKP